MSMTENINKPAVDAVRVRDPHRPRFHFTPPMNWMNDPNGICHHDGRYHLYYQYNPNDALWGDIHWGHASSADLVRWRDEPVALAPSSGPDEGGCFSGSFALVYGQPTIYYTGYTDTAQVQCMATSDDLQRWRKVDGALIELPPAGVPRDQFRDPYVFQHRDVWYMVVGASLNGERGQCLLYRSDDGRDWKYLHPLYTSPRLQLGVMWECPNFFPIGDKWVLSVSVWQNMGAHYFVGRFENERFVPEFDDVLDVDGSAFAHLTFMAPDGRALQWAWINEQRSADLMRADGWAGAMTVPRVLGLTDAGQLTIRPVDEIGALRGDVAAAATCRVGGAETVAFEGRHLDIELDVELLDAKPVGLTLLASPDGLEATRIVYNPNMRRLTVERARSSFNPKTERQNQHAHLYLEPGEPLRLRVLLDATVIEVYANDRVNLTSRVYPTLGSSVGASVFAEGYANVALKAWQMGDIYGEPA
ncbi:glycoside hydrolase family 32 protein [Burkholderia guangdongensis]|uniref:glycoside hydrolase family 32 protein n=1 Tax=Burkholderia guangdongensis TaxID=1792500 RepID=UPI001FE4C68E|nr:glycoside hydrolase family 32 protein [Burkholderia guangdongensis]